MKTQKGFTLVEVMVAVGLVAIVGFALSTGIFHFRKIVQKAKVSQVVELQINDIVENIRPNINQYQVTFDYSPALREKRLDINSLPMAWDVGRIATKDRCLECPGRFGFMIQPFTNMPGLFVLTVRITHESWDKNFKDYAFLVTSK